MQITFYSLECMQSLHLTLLTLSLLNVFFRSKIIGEMVHLFFLQKKRSELNVMNKVILVLNLLTINPVFIIFPGSAQYNLIMYYY